MPPRPPVPPALHGRAFTRAEALEHGVTRRMLQSKRFVMIHPGVYAAADLEQTLDVLVRADLLALRPTRVSVTSPPCTGTA